MSALMSFLNTDPPGPPNIPGLRDTQPSTSAPISTPSSSNRGYYSSGSLTATYSSSPQPPDQPPPPTQYPVQDQYGYQSQQHHPVQYGYPQHQYYPTSQATTNPYYQPSTNPLNPLFQKK